MMLADEIETASIERGSKICPPVAEECVVQKQEG
jgi:hypothetical protein